MSFSVYASDGLHILSYEGKAVQVTTRRKLTTQQFAVLNVLWPLGVYETIHALKLGVYVRDDRSFVSDWAVYDDKYHAFTVTAKGLALSEEMFGWLRGLFTEEEALRKLVMISGQDETWSFQEFGGTCYDLFRVGAAWREIGFVEDPLIKWVCLETDQQGFLSVSQWTQEDYDEMIEQFRKWSVEEDED